jgi:hypothetical protein
MVKKIINAAAAVLMIVLYCAFIMLVISGAVK